MKKPLENMLSKVDGLYCIVISDRDGVPLLKALTDKTPDSVLRPCLLSTYTSHKGPKLGLGQTKSIVSFFSSYQMIQTGYQSLIVTLIASEKANTSYMLTLIEKEMNPILSEVNRMFEETLNKSIQ